MCLSNIIAYRDISLYYLLPYYVQDGKTAEASGTSGDSEESDDIEHNGVNRHDQTETDTLLGSNKQKRSSFVSQDMHDVTIHTHIHTYTCTHTHTHTRTRTHTRTCTCTHTHTHTQTHTHTHITSQSCTPHRILYVELVNPRLEWGLYSVSIYMYYVKSSLDAYGTKQKQQQQLSIVH